MTLDDIITEQWKEIPNFPGYFASTLGRIKGHRKSILVPSKSKRNYLIVKLYIEGRIVTKTVHRLIIITFMGESHLECNHKDGNKFNNRLDNLEYLSKQENIAHAVKMGLTKVKLSNSTIKLIRDLEGTATQVELAGRFNITQGYVTKIFSKQTRSSGEIKNEVPV